MKKAEADLEALTTPPPRASAEALAAAEKSLDAAELKLARLKGPPNPADVKAARLELERAEAELLALQDRAELCGEASRQSRLWPRPRRSSHSCPARRSRSPG